MQRGGDRGHSCCRHLLSSRRGPSLGPGCRRQGDMSNSSASLSKHPPDQRRWLVEAGPAPPPPRVHSDTSGTDRGLLNGHYFDSLDTCLHQNINSIKTHLPLPYLLLITKSSMLHCVLKFAVSPRAALCCASQLWWRGTSPHHAQAQATLATPPWPWPATAATTTATTTTTTRTRRGRG